MMSPRRTEPRHFIDVWIETRGRLPKCLVPTLARAGGKRHELSRERLEVIRVEVRVAVAGRDHDPRECDAFDAGFEPHAVHESRFCAAHCPVLVARLASNLTRLHRVHGREQRFEVASEPRRERACSRDCVRIARLEHRATTPGTNEKEAF